MRRKYLYSLIAIILTILAIYIAAPLVLKVHVQQILEKAITHKTFIQSWISCHYFQAACLYCAAYICHSALALPATSILIILGGMLFSQPFAILMGWLSALIGGSIAYVAVRTFFGAWIQKRYHSQLARAGSYFTREQSTLSLIIARLIPIVPFALVNVLCGITNISYPLFIGTMAIGIVPSLYLYTSIGAEIEHISETHTLNSTTIYAISAALVALLIITYVMQRRLNRSTKL